MATAAHAVIPLTEFLRSSSLQDTKPDQADGAEVVLEPLATAPVETGEPELPFGLPDHTSDDPPIASEPEAPADGENDPDCGVEIEVEPETPSSLAGQIGNRSFEEEIAVFVTAVMLLVIFGGWHLLL